MTKIKPLFVDVIYLIMLFLCDYLVNSFAFSGLTHAKLHEAYFLHPELETIIRPILTKGSEVHGIIVLVNLMALIFAYSSKRSPVLKIGIWSSVVLYCLLIPIVWRVI